MATTNLWPNRELSTIEGLKCLRCPLKASHIHVCATPPKHAYFFCHYRQFCAIFNNYTIYCILLQEITIVDFTLDLPFHNISLNKHKHLHPSRVNIYQWTIFQMINLVCSKKVPHEHNFILA